jgi:DoxX.
MATDLTAARSRLTDPGYQAFFVLRTVFTVAPIVFGLDKFTNMLAEWPRYLAPWIDTVVPGSAQQVMYGVGVVEIVAGIVVAVAPRFGGWLVAAWLAGREIRRAGPRHPAADAVAVRAPPPAVPRRRAHRLPAG